MSIHFTKMHGLGNDFMVINAIDNPVILQPKQIVALANRHTGIGFDQLLIIEKSQHADFFCRIFNSDGTEAEQCGNGLRCVARYLQEEKLITNTVISIETKAGVFAIIVDNFERIKVTMGIPHIQEKLIGLEDVSEANLPISVLSLGNPHAIMKVDSLDSVKAQELSDTISALDYFPNGVNVGFMQIKNPSHIRLRTFERGIGETRACGSNACAAAVAGIINGWLENAVNVEFVNGSLWIEWRGEGTPVNLIGPATRVFSGVLN